MRHGRRAHLFIACLLYNPIITNISPKQSTTGGTSDARFIKDLCPVIEFGLVGKLMHKVDEKVSVNDILILTEIYENFLKNFFKKND